MIKAINLGNKNESITALNSLKTKKGGSRYIRIINSNIKELNKVIGRKVFKKDALYINSLSLWEIMQPVGGKGSHHYHGLTPEQVYGALSRLKYSKEIYTSYEDRYIVITDVAITNEVKLIVIVTPNAVLYKERKDNVAVIITIYPSDSKNIVVSK